MSRAGAPRTAGIPPPPLFWAPPGGSILGTGASDRFGLLCSPCPSYSFCSFCLPFLSGRVEVGWVLIRIDNVTPHQPPPTPAAAHRRRSLGALTVSERRAGG
jgi:hypothetical protein